MTETAHTPLPWRAGDSEIFGADDSVVCTVHWRSGDDCHQANLETIVQAVNSHHRLIEALEVMRGYGCPVCSGDCGSANPPVMSCPMLMIDAALKEAGCG